MRICTHCRRRLYESEFNQKPDGTFNAYCNRCILRARLDKQLYRTRHSDKEIQRQRQWRLNNKDKDTACTLRWRKVNPPKVKIQQQRSHQVRRNLEAVMLGSHTLADWELKKAEFNYCCAYCGEKPKRLEKDHIIPLSKHGSNIIDNILPACPNCNKKKHNN